ncbi:hypothetical protein CLV24_1476 [Pontibacter ummariensis]|uniref:PhoD-like phosphatase domain-containing protein n=1 Tax=Pontibacter ummariensis TaxID=1610492 RepID=A0A239LN28_9BACT|nr:alkaline phosphatase D family protein [Pontibacter ummariensis]PRY02753.1 hypothetical protein CLV24_1476 [Pontibacter ummariensis]SNT30994.1 hypothetical protein SAMN06296052_1449 [Pontibacter ummariensis]
MANNIVTGPVLGFRGAQRESWGTSALIVTKGDTTPPRFSLTVSGMRETEGNSTELLKTYGDYHVWRTEWTVLRTEEEQTVNYSINGAGNYSYKVPEINKPLRISYGSCFDFHSPKDMKKIKDPDAMWKHMQGVHMEAPYHLLFMGGDQVYADSLWERVPELKAWLEEPLEERIKAEFTEEMKKGVEQYYFELYCHKWNRKAPAEMMRQIPTLMMWDDHDIFDGWGSYPKAQQECPVYQGIYKIAREYFSLFQLQAKDEEDLGQAFLSSRQGFTYAHRVGDIALVALDLRSERTQQQVMSLESWNKVRDWMDEELREKRDKEGKVTQAGCKHLLVMSSIPLVYVNLNMLESAFGLLPGQQEMEDDFRDQWLSRTHQEERLRLIHRLLKFSEETGCRVTVVSGDVHAAALGYIQSDRQHSSRSGANVINQLTSSAMVNTPPPGLVVYMLEKVLGGKVEDIDRGITAQLLKFPGSSQRIIGARNWLSLTLDEQRRVWAEWYVEGQETPYTKVVNPVGAKTD